MLKRDWSDTENDVLVADYFSMLTCELSGKPYQKAEHNREMQKLLGRSKASIEFKHCNISAAVMAFGLPILKGYQPRFNFQMSLAEAVDRWLNSHPEWIQNQHSTRRSSTSATDTSLSIHHVPTLKSSSGNQEQMQLETIAKHFDIAGRDERNRALGRAGEEYVLHFEQNQLRLVGRDDLAKRICWVSQEGGDGAGYDIESFTPEGNKRFIEVKTTNGWEQTPFYISSNEIRVATTRSENWYLYRLYDFASAPKAFVLRPPLEDHIKLTAASFQASFS